MNRGTEEQRVDDSEEPIREPDATGLSRGEALKNTAKVGIAGGAAAGLLGQGSILSALAATNDSKGNGKFTGWAGLSQGEVNVLRMVVQDANFRTAFIHNPEAAIKQSGQKLTPNVCPEVLDVRLAAGDLVEFSMPDLAERGYEPLPPLIARGEARALSAFQAAYCLLAAIHAAFRSEVATLLSLGVPTLTIEDELPLLAASVLDVARANPSVASIAPALISYLETDPPAAWRTGAYPAAW